MSGRLVSSAAWEIDSRPMKETMATVMPQPKFGPGDAGTQLSDAVHEGLVVPDDEKADEKQRDLADDAEPDKTTLKLDDSLMPM